MSLPFSSISFVDLPKKFYSIDFIESNGITIEFVSSGKMVTLKTNTFLNFHYLFNF